MMALIGAVWMFPSVLFLIIINLAVVDSVIIPQVTKQFVRVFDLSHRLVPYNTAYHWQEKLLDQHMKWQTEQLLTPANEMISSDALERRCVGSLLCLQHSSVYTLGSAASEDSGPFFTTLPNGKQLTYDVVKADRGGKTTYHGPGQFILYPILDLHYFNQDIHLYLRQLEDVPIHFLADYYHVQSGREEGLTGVWNENAKIAAIGVKLRRWITMHGMSININPDLDYFQNIVPCGISDKAVTSLEQILQQRHLNDAMMERKELSYENIAKELYASFAHIFARDCEILSEEESIHYLTSLL